MKRYSELMTELRDKKGKKISDDLADMISDHRDAKRANQNSIAKSLEKEIKKQAKKERVDLTGIIESNEPELDFELMEELENLPQSGRMGFKQFLEEGDEVENVKRKQEREKEELARKHQSELDNAKERDFEDNLDKKRQEKERERQRQDAASDEG